MLSANRGVKVLVKTLEGYDYSDNNSSSLYATALPRYQTPGAAGFDLRAQLNHLKSNPSCLNGSYYIEKNAINPEIVTVTILPGKAFAIPTRLSFQIPDGYEFQIRCRSGLSLQRSLFCPNAPGTIDSDYRGEVHVVLANYGTEPQSVDHGERIAQAVLSPVSQAELILTTSLNDTCRGSRGFGSTGLN